MTLEFFPEKNIILQIGSISLYFYGAMYALSAIAGVFLTRYLAKQKGLTIENDTILDLVFWTMLGGVLGGRVFEILVYNFQFYFSNPLEIFMVWHGGMSIHGGFIGGTIAFVVFCRIKKLPLGIMANIITPAFALGLMFGRFGNFMNNELYGRITDIPWGMDFGDGENRHPAQLYAVAKDFILFVISYCLLTAKSFSHKYRHAEIFLLFIGMYGVLRFIVEFFKEIDSITGLFFGWMTIGQMLSILMIVTSITLWKIRKKIF